jgi:hypothetical protein
VPNYLGGAQVSAKATTRHGPVMIVKAEDRQVFQPIVSGVLVYVMNLDWLPGLIANAARVMMLK